jgi:hypothetical protein
MGCCLSATLREQLDKLQRQATQFQNELTELRSQDTLRLELARRENDLRREADVREARHEGELSAMRKALADAAAREEQLRGELREVQLRLLLHTRTMDDAPRLEDSSPLAARALRT